MERQKINVIKCGGASIEDGEHIKMLSDYIYSFGGTAIIVVLSAVKGVTRLLDSIFEAKEINNEPLIRGRLQDFYLIHTKIIFDLSAENKKMLKAFESLFDNLKDIVLLESKYNKEEMRSSILQFGELSSSIIFSLYLKQIKINNKFIDIRDYIKTASNGKDVLIHPESERLIKEGFGKVLKKKPRIIITQGFIGKDYKSGENTVLPFDGSDTSAAFIAHSVMASKIFFLKDVCGVCAGDDPKPGDTSNFYHHMTYTGYLKRFLRKKKYPVHPFAIKILGIKKIPTRICSFYYPHIYGTEIKT